MVHLNILLNFEAINKNLNVFDNFKVFIHTDSTFDNNVVWQRTEGKRGSSNDNLTNISVSNNVNIGYFHTSVHNPWIISHTNNLFFIHRGFYKNTIPNPDINKRRTEDIWTKVINNLSYNDFYNFLISPTVPVFSI